MVACATFEGGFVSPMRVVLYARVSTHDQQTLAMQIDAMRKFVTRRGWTVTDAIEALALVPQRTAPSARSCSKRLGNASSRSLWCGSSTVGVR
jgi:Resolvase, N terminal domain